MAGRKLRQNVNGWSRIERLVRSRILGFPFVVVNALTKWEVHGRENLEAALRRRDATGRGLVTVSNHASLFDDPLVIMGLLGIHSFTVETKCWWSTACAANFNPQGRSLGSKFVRYFSDVSNMIFLSRAKKRKDAPPTVLDDPLEYLSGCIGDEGMARLMALAEREGRDIVGYLRSFYTKGPDGIHGSMAPLNQIGMIETIAKINAGQWIHLFPEGGRSRDVHLRAPRSGVGKVIYHAGESIVLPLCFHGTQDVLPVGAVLPRPFKKVVVNIGAPLSADMLDDMRRRPASLEVYGEVSHRIMHEIAALRPLVLERYFGAEGAAKVLLEETQLAQALASVDEAARPSDVFVETPGTMDRARQESLYREPSSSPLSGVGVTS
jgi:1-acyl-sn-glycerol-3-phosphate acyltransferase